LVGLRFQNAADVLERGSLRRIPDALALLEERPNLVPAQAPQSAIDLGEGQVLVLQEADEPEPVQVIRRVARTRPGGAGAWQQPLLDVVVHGPWGDASSVAQLFDVKVGGHLRTMTALRLAVNM
jgi:hypothetical protein